MAGGHGAMVMIITTAMGISCYSRNHLETNLLVSTGLNPPETGVKLVKIAEAEQCEHISSLMLSDHILYRDIE